MIATAVLSSKNIKIVLRENILLILMMKTKHGVLTYRGTRCFLDPPMIYHELPCHPSKSTIVDRTIEDRTMTRERSNRNQLRYVNMGGNIIFGSIVGPAYNISPTCKITGDHIK